MRCIPGKLHLPLLLALLVCCASCSGGVSQLAPAGGSATVAAEGSTSRPAGGLPTIPLDSGSPRTSSASDSGTPPVDPPANITVLGKDYLQMFGGAVTGNALELSSAAGTERQDLSYGLYKVSGLGEGRPLSLNVECLAGALGDGYFIGVANYTQARWSWFGPVRLPEFQLDLSKNNHRFVTQLGNLYFLLVCPPGVTLTHSQTTVVMGNGGGEVPPGLAHGLRASDGGFDHQIALDWEPGAGAQNYEVWRRPAFDTSKWEQVALAQGVHFMDQNRPNLRLFYYRVRALNANGPAEFSNVDAGYAGLHDPGSIDGVVRGEDGQPLAGVPLELAGFGPDMARVTGPDGHFHFGGLAPAHYVVAPLPRDIDFEPRFVLADLTEPNHADLVFTAHPAAPGAVVWGFVMTPNLNPDGSGDGLLPLGGVALTLTDVDEPGHVLNTQTDDHGFYMFNNLPGGPFKVKPQKAGFSFAPPEQPVLLGPDNSRERVGFIGFPPPPGGDPGDPAGGGSSGGTVL